MSSTPTGTSARIQGWLAECESAWGAPGLCGELRVEFNGRIRRSLGRCHVVDGKVRLHPGLATAPDALLREVVCHEAAHAVVHRLHGRAVRPHGREWGELMRAVGLPARARLGLGDLPEAMQRSINDRPAYRHRCGDCGAERIAYRRMSRWRCAVCFRKGRAGRLEIEPLKGT